jgi:hypothetical protein
MSQSLHIIKEFAGLKINGSEITPKTALTSVTDATIVTTVGANTATSAAGLSLVGDTSVADQSVPIMTDILSLQQDVDNLQITVNLILARLRTYGVIVV